MWVRHNRDQGGFGNQTRNHVAGSGDVTHHCSDEHIDDVSKDVNFRVR